jgi:monofunctional biosynthetic peptidoglycan transglycosylase
LGRAFGTGRSIFRKGAEFTLVPVAEFVLGKRRILEIYLNERMRQMGW